MLLTMPSMRCRALLAGRAGLRLFAAPVKQAWMRGLLGLLGTLALLLTSAVGIDNGIGMVPPQGWRSWNSFPCEQSSATQLRGGDIIDDAAMRAQMAAVKDRSRKLFNGSTISLAGTKTSTPYSLHAPLVQPCLSMIHN